MRPVSPRFIACHRSLADARIVLYGIPFEGRVNLRKGADGGPRDLRLASDSIETYSPFLDRDMEDLPLADIGDCELPDGAPPREQLDAARDEIRAWWRPGLIPFMLGGDHTATVPVIEALAPAFPDLRILQFDAHPDLREEFLGERYNYASAMARVMDTVPAERVYQVGIRTGAREEYARHRPRFYPAFAVHPLDAVRTILPELRGHPLYVTIDVDVLDPAEAPGTCGEARAGVLGAALLRDRVRHEPQGRGRLPRPLLQALRAAAGAARARHRLRHRPAPGPPRRARLSDGGPRPLAVEHRVPGRAARREGPRRRAGRRRHDRLPSGHAGGRRALHAGFAGPPAHQRAARRASQGGGARRAARRPVRLRPLHGVVVDGPRAGVVLVAAARARHRARLVLGAPQRQPGHPGVP